MNRIILILIFLMLFSVSAILAQNQIVDLKTYSKDFLNFSYPTNWQFTDNSTKDFQQLNLTIENGNVLILVFAYNPKVKTHNEFVQVNRAYVQQFINKLSDYYTPEKSSSGAPVSALHKDNLCIKIDGFNIPSYKMTGLYNNEPSTSLIHSFALDEHFISLIYFKKNKYSSIGDAGWEIVTKSLNVGKKDSPKTRSLILDSDDEAVLNGKAISLPAPFSSPSVNLKFRTVRIEIKVDMDKKGNVISAKGISGDMSFYPAAIQAAMKAKFHPTYVCGEPSPASGIIVYNFVFK